MDPRLLKYYNRELQHVREMGAEFAQEYPKIAGRLGLEGFECADPYVERLLEGFGFLAARVQLKIDAEFPHFTEHLLEMIYPHYLAPVPSMVVVQFQPDLTEGALAAGFTLPRGTVLRSQVGKDEQTPCEYRTAHDTTLWPLELPAAEYFTRDRTSLELPDVPGVKAGFQLRLRTTAGLSFDKLSLDRLTLFVRGTDSLPMHIYEQMLANALAVVVRPVKRPLAWQRVLPASSLARVGFDDAQAMLPCGPRSFTGYRLLQEYFAFPQRYMFVELAGLSSALSHAAEGEIELLVLLDRSDSLLENTVDAGNFALGCCPAVNLFPRRADRIHLSEQTPEYHVVPDRTRPLDFEVHSITNVAGFGAAGDSERTFLPFYGLNGLAHQGAYYAIRRVPRVLSARQRAGSTRSSYVGSETFLSLVDGNEGPYHHDLRQLGLDTLCTNRDLPLQVPVGRGNTDFTLEASAPVQAVRCLAGPTKPRAALAYGSGEAAWRIISHLSLNYLSLFDNDAQQGAVGLRELLTIYADISEAPTRKQIEGVLSVVSRPIVRRLPIAGPTMCGRGLEVAVTFDEAAFEGSGVFLLGAVLEEFFARYVTLNSFTETVVKSRDRGEVMRWPVRAGRRATL